LKNSYSLAFLLSNILSTPIVGIFFGIFSPYFLGYDEPLTKSFLIFAGIIVYGIVPFIPAFFRIVNGNSDIYVSKLEERPRTFILGILGYILSAILFFQLGFLYHALFSITFFIATLLTLAITFRWKISIHMIGFCGPITILSVISKGLFNPAFVLVPILMWARVEIKAHTWAQVIMGSVFGIVASYYTITLLMGALQVRV